MSVSTITDLPEQANPSFETTMKSTVNHGATSATASAVYSEWLGRHDVHLYFGDRVLDGFYLESYEARDLAETLLALATFIDEEAGR